MKHEITKYSYTYIKGSKVIKREIWSMEAHSLYTQIQYTCTTNINMSLFDTYKIKVKGEQEIEIQALALDEYIKCIQGDYIINNNKGELIAARNTTEILTNNIQQYLQQYSLYSFWKMAAQNNLYKRKGGTYELEYRKFI